MPFLQSSGAISIANLNSFFPGSGTSMSNFYRGGGRVPATKTVTTVTREPTSGERYIPGNTAWVVGEYSSGVLWDGQVATPDVAGSPTSITVGNITYFRGSFAENIGYSTNVYAVYRTVTTTSTVNINTGIPSSGQISLNQFYGAETP